MSFESQVAELSYQTDGVSTVFSLAGLYFMQAADIRASWGATGADLADLDGGADFNVSGDGRSGSGSLTTTTAKPAGTLHIWCATPIGQPEEYSEGDGFPAATHERAQDRDAMQARDILRQVLRAIRAPDNELPVNWVVPSKSVRANKLLSFDDAGNLTTDNLSLEGAEAVLADAQATLEDIQAALAQLGAQVVGFSKPTDSYLNTPAGTEPDGYRALVWKAPAGAFAGQRGQIAEKIGGNWLFSGAPKAGQRVWDKGTNLWWASQNGWWNRILSNLPGAVAQDFADVPDGTAADGLVLATGQAMTCQGQGGATTFINNGRIEPSDNIYNVVPVPYKNMSLWMEGAWRAGHSGNGSLTISAGQLNAGAIITGHMVHMQHLFQAKPTVEIWNGPDVTAPLNYLFNDDIQNLEQTDSNYAPVPAGSKVEISMKIMECVIIACTNMQRFTTTYYNHMVSNMVGDIAPGDGNGYVYFQSGGVAVPDANNPYIYRFIAEPLPATFYAQNPRYAPTPDLVPMPKSTNIPFGSAVELYRYSPVDGGAANGFEIDISIAAGGVVLGYAITLQKWRCAGGKFSGAITAPAPTQLGSDYVMALNPAVISLSGVLSQVIDGNDIVIKFTPSRTGSDATTYDPPVKALLRQTAEIVGVT